MEEAEAEEEPAGEEETETETEGAAAGEEKETLLEGKKEGEAEPNEKLMMGRERSKGSSVLLLFSLKSFEALLLREEKENKPEVGVGVAFDSVVGAVAVVAKDD